MNGTWTALLLAGLGLAAHALVLRPAREEADAVAVALAAAQRQQSALRARIAEARTEGEGQPARVRSALEVRRAVLGVLGDAELRDLRLSVRPGSQGVEVRVTGRAAFVEASRLPGALVKRADLVLLRVSLNEAGDGVRFDIQASSRSAP